MRSYENSITLEVPTHIHFYYKTGMTDLTGLAGI